MEWLINEYPKQCTKKMDIGKSCLRFKKLDQIPFELIGGLSGKMSSAEWINIYETKIKR